MTGVERNETCMWIKMGSVSIDWGKKQTERLQYLPQHISFLFFFFFIIAIAHNISKSDNLYGQSAMKNEPAKCTGNLGASCKAKIFV